MAAVCLFVLSGCSWFCRIPQDPVAACAGDRCFIEDPMFIEADKIFSKSSSIVLTERILREEKQWRNCEVNEAIYRLKKVHDLP